MQERKRGHKETERERKKEMFGLAVDVGIAAMENQAVTPNPNGKICGVEGIIGR